MLRWKFKSVIVWSNREIILKYNFLAFLHKIWKLDDTLMCFVFSFHALKICSSIQMGKAELNDQEPGMYCSICQCRNQKGEMACP